MPNDFNGTSDPADGLPPLQVSVSDHVATSEHVLIQVPPARLTIRAGAAPSVMVTQTPGSVLPKTEVDLNRAGWDFATISGGATVGGIVSLFAGDPRVNGLIGVAVFVGWGRWMWRQRYTSRL